MESLLKRIEKNRKEHDRLIALILCLSMIVSMGTFAVFHKKAVAKTYTRQVLDCPFGAEGAVQVAHTHNDDCYDENHTLVCPLTELEAHTHNEDCYTAVSTLICELPERDGHVHSEACYSRVPVCGEEEREATFDEEGNMADPGHIHTPDCFAEVLSCGMEEGDGAHTHTDACYETEYVLACDKPEIRLHVHTDDCYQKNEDGSIYVDEDGFSRLICGLPEIIQHAHGPECFKIYELDDGEPEEADEIVAADEIAAEPAEDTETAESIDEEKTDTEESGDKENTELTENEEAKETTDTEDMTVPAVLMPAQSWERTAGGIKVSVEAPEGAFPENTRIAVTPVNGSSLMDTVSDAVNGEVLEVQAVDITFFDANGREIEPAIPIRVVMTPAATEHAEEKTNVVHVDVAQQTAELIEQAAGTEFDNSEVVFDADAFTIYAIVFTYEVSCEYEVDGKIYTSSMPGAEDMPLSEIVRGLGIVDEAELETFLSRIATVVSTNTEVATVEATAGDWTIRAVKDGNAYINVTMQDGSVFSVKAEATGVTEISDENEVATVSTVNDLYLPAAGEVKAELLTEEQSETVISAVQTATETDESSAATYQAFSIALENVDVTAYDGFNVSVTLPEDAVIGKDFQLYQVREDGTAVDLTESLTVTSVPNDNGLQNVSGIRFKTEDFADFVLSYSIETNYTAFDGKTFKISLNYGPEAEIPDGAELKVEEILPETETFAQYLNDSVTELGVKSRAVSFARFFDIEIQKDGEKIEPKAPVSVKIEMMNLPEETENAAAQVIHFGEQTEVLSAEAVGTDVSFETGSFSVYGVVYTVDFHYEINGQTFEFSIPGGGFISLEHLIEALGIRVGDADDINSITEEFGEDSESSAETAVEEIEAAWAAEPEAAGTEENGNVDAAAAYEQAIHLNNIPVSEETRAFIEDIESVEFSSPELVWVGKTETESTVGALKEANGLEIEYSANLREEQIAEINAQTVEAGDWALISVRPFLSEESLIVTMKNGDSFTICVTDGQIRKTVIDAKGDTWEITVTYGDDARIPDDAELKVEEILPGDEDYAEYYEEAVLAANRDAEKHGMELPMVIGAHLFDIEIHGEAGKVEPAASVQVRIRLVEEKPEMQTVVHFTESGVETMILKESANPVRTEKALTAQERDSAITDLTFETMAFSVYTVVSVTNFAAVAENGPYALVTGIANDPGATTGYQETWGQDYFTIIVNANAMTDESINNAFKAEGVRAWTDGTNNYVGGDVPEVWFFEPIPNSNNYYIYVLRNNIKYYINQYYGSQEGSSLSTEYKTDFTITPNSDGTVSIFHQDGNNKWYLGNSGDGEWNNREFKFNNNPNSSQDCFKFRLCKQADGFDSFAARKVAVKDLSASENFIIYRKFEDSEGNETLYALAHDGTFVRVYDGGDTVYWRETDKNIYWNYLDTGHGYSIFTTNPTTNEKVFLNPVHSTSQTMSGNSVGLTLLGKDTGEYGTAIENWDQSSYDYAGLHVTVDNDGVAHLSTGTRVAGTSDEFLFAVASTMPGATAETVATVDSDSLGVKITMFDYGDWDGNYNAGDKLSEMTNIAGSADYTPHAAHALVKPYLESGVPSSKSNGAMTGLFFEGGAIKSSKSNVNHLFLQSYYDENGTFRYRSEDNYAYLPFSNGQITGRDFTVYRQAATPYTTDKQPGHTYYYHGHFMPFNDIDMTQHVGRLMNQYGNAYDPSTGEIIGEIPIGDGRTYEEIYGTQGIPNFYTGMKMEANFTQPRDGKLENGDEMIFKFTGDDDMWVYIDDVLVLDIGGIHEPLSGTINFATGVVTNPTGSSLAGTTTLYQIFQNVLTASSTPQSVKDKINAITWKDVNGDGTPDTFADYTNHSFSAFYMERGAGASNLDIQFNLKVVLTNQFTVQKEIPEGVDERFNKQVYRFQATYMDGTTEKPLYAGIENICTSVVYKDKKDGQGNPVPVSVDENGYFYLRAGEAAVFMMADESIRYNVKEVDIDGNLIERVEINGQQATVAEGTAEAGYAMVEERTHVSVTNHPKTQNLLITKHLTEDSAPSEDGENPVFEFRVYLETTVTKDGTTQQQLVPYSYGPYYLVKEDENDGELHYYTLTGTNNAPVDAGTEPVVCSTTGRSGSINSIPPEYTIIIPNLVVGTNFYLEERRDNIPEGYEFVREELTDGTYEESSLISSGSSADVISRVLARDETDHQKFDPDTVGQIKNGVDAESHVYNRKLKQETDITVEKQWAGNMPAGNSTIVLYKVVGSSGVPSSKISVNIQAEPAPVTTSAGSITVNYSGTKADGTEDSGSFILSNATGWSKAFTFDRGGGYSFTYTPDGEKVLTVESDKRGSFSESTTVTLTTTAAEIAKYTYTFSVPENQRSNKGSIEVTCNGSTQTACKENNWTVCFDVAEENQVTFSARPDGRFVESVELSPETASPASENVDVTITPTYAATTMTVPVSVNWNSEPDAGTEVTVTFTPDKAGVSAQTVTLNSTSWSTNKELQRLDDNGDLITWTIGTSIHPTDENAQVSLLTPSNNQISDNGSVVLYGTVARVMNLTIHVPASAHANFAEFFLVDSSTKERNSENISFESGYKGNGSEYSKRYDNLSAVDNGETLYYAIKVYDAPYRIMTNAENAGTGIDNGNPFLWFKAKSGDVIIRFEQSASRNWEINTNQTMNASSAPRMLTMVKAPRFTVVPSYSTIQTFYDASVGGTGNQQFTEIRFKDLPAGAEAVETVTLTGNESKTWAALPNFDNNGNRIYYYVVEKDATAQADTMTVTYQYTYRSDGSIEKVTIINTTDGTQKPDTKDFSFTKIWRVPVGETRISWPSDKSITVTIKQDSAEYAKYTISSDNLAVGTEITAAGNTEGDKAKLVVIAADSATGYVFRLSGLPYGDTDNEYTYYVAETKVDGYQSPKYFVGTDQAMGAEWIGDGGTICNDQIGYVLPSTGGSGIGLFTLIGGFLSATAGAILTLTSHRRRKEQYT